MKPVRQGSRVGAQRGATMIEVLVSLVIAALGLGTVIGLQVRAYGAESESYDRAQALVLLEDMVQRINANRLRTADYVSSDFGTSSPPGDCGSTELASRDLCEWNRSLVRLLPGARACVEVPALASTGLPGTELRVTVVWRGTMATATPAASCGQNAFTAQPGLRRALSSVVRIGNLSS